MKVRIVLCFVVFKEEVLLLKRSNLVDGFKGKWNGVSGYVDEDVSEKVFEELYEELHVSEDDVKRFELGDSYEVHEEDLDRDVVVTPVLVELKRKVPIQLDWEHTEYAWVEFDKMNSYDVVDKLEVGFERVR